MNEAYSFSMGIRSADSRPGRHWIHTRVLPRTIIIVQAGVMEKTDWY